MLRSVLLVLFLACGSSASPFPVECDTPTLENGWVEVQQRSSGLQETPKVYGAKQSSSSSFVGRFHCHPGFDLSGSETVKCLGGVWSARSLPVCTAMGSCEEELLPSITNGFRRGVGKLTNSVFRYKCLDGFLLMGDRSVHCDGQKWVMGEQPVCIKGGCDKTELLGKGLAHGRARSMFGGAVFRFKCDKDAVLEGHKTVYCDGESWNSTRPECLVPPPPPMMTLLVDGKILDNRSLEIGEKVEVFCRSQGGNPVPQLSFLMNNQQTEEPVVEDDQGILTMTLTAAMRHQGAQLSCTAKNKMAPSPVYTQLKTLRIKFAPARSYISGPELAQSNRRVTYVCQSNEADPPPAMTLFAEDQAGAVLEADTAELKVFMEGGRSRLEVSFLVAPGTKRLEVQCRADNVVGEAVSNLATQIIYAPMSVDISGPVEVLPGPDAEYTCTVGEAFPEPIITWTRWTGDKKETISEEDTTIEVDYSDHGVRKASKYTLFNPSNDPSLRLTCSAAVTDLDSTMDSPVMDIAFIYPPTEMSISGPDTAVQGNTVTWGCSLIGGSPAEWATMEVKDGSGRVLASQEGVEEIEVVMEEGVTELSITCLAANKAGNLTETKEVAVMPTTTSTTTTTTTTTTTKTPTTEEDLSYNEEGSADTEEFSVYIDENSTEDEDTPSISEEDYLNDSSEDKEYGEDSYVDEEATDEYRIEENNDSDIEEREQEYYDYTKENIDSRETENIHEKEPDMKKIEGVKQVFDDYYFKDRSEPGIPVKLEPVEYSDDATKEKHMNTFLDKFSSNHNKEESEGFYQAAARPSPRAVKSAKSPVFMADYSPRALHSGSPLAASSLASLVLTILMARLV